MSHSRLMTIAAALGLLAAAPAFAQPIAFDNSAGTFLWSTQKTWWDTGITQQIAYLNITQPASQTLSSSGPNFVSLVLWPEPSVRGGGFVFDATNASIAVSGTFSTNKGLGSMGFKGTTNLPIAQALQAGDTVGSGLTFGTAAYTQWLNDPSGSESPSTVLFNGPAYLGVTITLDDGLHYGWIEIQPQTPSDPAQSSATSAYYAPLAWAYESTPNTAITIPAPEPASLALLAVPLLLGLRRRRSAE